MTQFVLTSVHEFYYSNKKFVPIPDIIESLLSIEKLIQLSPSVLEHATNIPIHKIEVYVDEVSAGSLLEKIAVRLFFKSEEDMEAYLDKIREKVQTPGMAKNLFLTTVIATIIGYGLYWAASSKGDVGATTINANNNVIINLGAGQVDLTPEAFKAIVETAVTDKKAAATNAVGFLKPARGDLQATIKLDQNEALEFKRDVINAAPLVVEFPKQEQFEDIHDVDLQIRATNLDSLKQGWAAIIPDKVDRRVRLVLDPSVKPSEIAGRFQVRADVTLFKKLDKTGSNFVPDYIYLRNLIKDNNSK